MYCFNGIDGIDDSANRFGILEIRRQIIPLVTP